MEELSLVLWRERELLDTLLYRVELEQLVLASGRARWHARTAQDVAAARTTVGETELLRAVVTDEAAAAAGLAPGPTLRELAEGSDEPWRTILTDHRDALVALTRSIAERATGNHDLVAAGRSRTPLRVQAREADSGATLGSAVHVVQASLADFLR
ncbi:flagellar export chaperone FlgN [Nocardioides zeae]|uniref:Flagellar protein FlgN n=1 Tax=Nocardioides zeae TaxID=1457234 RepID=A0A6P0HRD5_9ACTN|nr:flagellar export chaperone FlgN [Nocardioides zeae]NEN80690.1 flagellar protein FlgN [Nocardioides zeae]